MGYICSNASGDVIQQTMMLLQQQQMLSCYHASNKTMVEYHNTLWEDGLSPAQEFFGRPMLIKLPDHPMIFR